MECREPRRRNASCRASSRHAEPRHVSADAGFTLVELLVVMVVIGVIALVGIPNLLRAKVRAEMLGQVKMTQQAIAVSRINAIKGRQTVALQMEGVGAAQALVAWADNNGNQLRDDDERVVGRWTYRNAFTVFEDPSMRFFRLGGSTPGILFQPTGSAIVAQGTTSPSGEAATVISDINGNQIRLRIQASTGTVIQEMKIPGSSQWDRTSRHWRY